MPGLRGDRRKAGQAAGAFVTWSGVPYLIVRLIYKTTLTTNAATANIDINHIERVDGQLLSSQARCVRYTRQSAQLSDAAATLMMNIVDDAKRARDTAPITCSRAAAQSSAQ